MTRNYARKASDLLFAATAFSVLAQAALATTCDRAGLLEQAKQFNAATLGHTPEKIQLRHSLLRRQPVQEADQ
jgi:hypothetical protein